MHAILPANCYMYRKGHVRLYIVVGSMAVPLTLELNSTPG